MGGKRQNIQYSLALDLTGRGESPLGGHQGTEPPVAKPDPESPALAEQIMEEVCERENCETAWKHVRKNKGGPGVDGMTTDAARDYLREHWPSIRSQLLDGTYQPQPVKRVEIPKPDGGVRKLGVPCVVDRLVQQPKAAMHLVDNGAACRARPAAGCVSLHRSTDTALPAWVETAAIPGTGPAYVDRWHCDDVQIRARSSIASPNVPVEHSWAVVPRQAPGLG